jgi:hypothetical protein
MSQFVCEFCRKTLASESRLFNHLCERKRRFLQRDDKSVRLAFAAYNHFYEKAQRRSTTLDKFETSPYYAAFVKFARYLIDLNAVSPMGFVDFLLRIDAKLDHWTHPSYYGTYIRELSKNETPRDALVRNIMLMESWALDTGEDWRDFFRKISPAKATLWIMNGKISPWLLFTASSAPRLWERLTPEQRQKVNQAIDSQFWSAKIARHQSDVDEFCALLTKDRI